MSVLDDPKTYAELDPGDMLGRIRELPTVCRQAWEEAMAFDLAGDYSGIDNVVFLGMGGSAIGGDFLGSLLAMEGGVPLTVCRDYDLPRFAGRRTLVLASSYSGETEETLSAFTQALATDAPKLVITTGGRLQALAKAKGVPVFPFEYRAQPRAAFGYSFIPLVALFQRMGLLADKSADMGEMVAELQALVPRYDATSPLAANPAKGLAQRLAGTLAVVYGAGITREVARRWKTQFNENGKAWAFHEVFPELNHNAVVGYEFPPQMAGQMFVALLSAPSLSPRLLARYRFTCELLAGAGVEHQVFEAGGTSPMCQMMSLVLLGDFASYYLAILNGTDPSPVRTIDHLKRRLAEV